jgi:hypothetical protein
MPRMNASTQPFVSPVPGQWVIQRRFRSWAVFDPDGTLVCITLYKRGADEVVRRLAAE